MHMTRARTLVAVALCLFVCAAPAAGTGFRHGTAMTDLSGTWRDPRSPTTWQLVEDTATLTFVAHGPWPGQPHGRVYGNGSVTLTFSATNTAIGVLSLSDHFITWCVNKDESWIMVTDGAVP